MFGPNVLVLTANHGTQPGDSIRTQAQVERDTAIENGAWLGTNVVVLPGVTVGAGAVVAAGAVVTPEGIVGGVPARIIGNR
jgi:acetyltransferase-like isoleucine patch superfamily enzyme